MNLIPKKYTLKPTKMKIKDEIVYDLIYLKDLRYLDDKFFKLNLF